MARYARNWVRGVEAGEAPAFVVLTEIQFRDETAKEGLRGVMNSSAANHLFEHMAERAAFMGERFRRAGPWRLPAASRTYARAGGGVGTRKLLLLRRAGEPAACERAVLEVATAVARAAPGAGVSVDLIGEGAPILSADAIVYLEGA